MVDDSFRLKTIESGIENKSFINCLSKEYYSKILNFKKTLNDPVNLGYVMTQSEVGKTLIRILSDRYFLNISDDFINEDPSRFMSEQDYIDYHKERIHIVNENKAIYKNLDAEISLEENLDICYFIFIKKNEKWLLDGVEICSKEKEEEFDIELIGEYRPIVYYEAKEYDYEE